MQGDFEYFYWDVKENMYSLLMFDVVQADVEISDELKQEIERDGVIIYEKTWKLYKLSVYIGRGGF